MEEVEEALGEYFLFFIHQIKSQMVLFYTNDKDYDIDFWDGTCLIDH